MSNHTAYELELTESQHAYLLAMAEKHGLPTPSKALRCLVNFAIDTPDSERDIFEEIRCRDC